jgi:hypothetical protein
MLFALAVSLSLAAGPTFSSAGTAGLSFVGSDALTVSPVVAARIGASQVTPVGVVRGRFATLLSFQQPSVLAGDLGSFLEFERPFADGGSWALRLEPFNPSMRLVTFDWANAFGRLFPVVTGLSPVLTTDLRLGAFAGFVSLRSTARLDQATGVVAAFFDVLAGASVTAGDWAIEARVTRLTAGTHPVLALLGRSEEQWAVFGASRVSWNRHGGVGVPLDLVTYAQDPARFERFFEAVDHGSSPAAATVSLEGGGGVQRLGSATMFLTMALQPLGYADAQARLRFGQTQLFVRMRAATASFIPADGQGLPPNSTLGDATATPAVSAFLGADHTIPGWHLTPGLLLRLVKPAVVTQALDFGGNAPPPGFAGPRTIALTDLGQYAVFSSGAVVSPRFAAKASLRWTPVDALCVVGELEVLVDPTSSRIDAMGVQLETAPLLTTRAQLLAQARF